MNRKLKGVSSVKSYDVRAAVSHISRKTSEMWGTQGSVCGGETAKSRFSCGHFSSDLPQIYFLLFTSSYPRNYQAHIRNRQREASTNAQVDDDATWNARRILLIARSSINCRRSPYSPNRRFRSDSSSFPLLRESLVLPPSCLWRLNNPGIAAAWQSGEDRLEPTLS